MSNEQVFIIVMVSFDHDADSIAIDPMSVHSELEVAIDCCTKLEEFNKTNNFFKSNNVEVTYDVLEFKMDEPPMLLGFLEKKKKALEESVEETIISLMKQGIVDQLIGEDGYFYYKLTKKGKEKLETMNVNPIIRKILKRNDEEE